MKLIIRLVVLIVVALFLFGGGFWFGNQWRGDPDGTSLENIKTDVPEKETETIQASDTKPESLKKTNQAEILEPQPTDIKKPESAQKIADKAIKDPPPSEENSPNTAKESSTPPPSSKPEESPTPSAPEKTTSVTPQETSLDKPAPTKAVAPKEKNPMPAAGEPQPKGEEAKESLSLIVTPEDLGENQIIYSVLAGSFLDKDLAEILLKQLKAKQYPAFMVNAWDNKSQLWYTVRVGRFTDVLQAQEAAKMLVMKERIPATVYGVGSLRYEEMPEAAGASPAESPATKMKSAPSKEESAP